MFNTLNSVTKLLNIFKSNLFVVLCLQTWSNVDFLMPYMFSFASSFSKPVLKFCRCLWSKCLSISSQGISCHIVLDPLLAFEISLVKLCKLNSFKSSFFSNTNCFVSIDNRLYLCPSYSITFACKQNWNINANRSTHI